MSCRIASSQGLAMAAAASKRAMSAQAATKSAPQIKGGDGQVKVTTESNGLTVVSVENGAPLTTLGVVLKVGPRNESYSQLGASHALRLAAGQAAKGHTAFGITRSIQQLGAGLHCVQGREHTLYATQLLREKVDDGIDYFLGSISQPAFKPWELDSNTNRMKLEIAGMCPESRTIEMLHKAAYRTGLGNSLYAPDYSVGKHKPSLMKEFFNQNGTNQRAVLVGLGIDHGDLQKYASILHLENGQGTSDKAKYHGGEIRCNSGGGLAYVCLAGEVAGMNNVKELVAAMLLQRVLGTGAHVKWGVGAGKLQKAVGDVGHAGVSAVNFSYSDSGLLGASIVCEAANAGKIVEAVAKTLRTVSVTAEEVKAAQKGLFLDTVSQLDNSLNRVEDFGYQALFLKDIVTPEKMQPLVEGVSVGDVQAVAKKISSGKLSLAATGNLSTVPYLDSL